MPRRQTSPVAPTSEEVTNCQRQRDRRYTHPLTKSIRNPVSKEDFEMQLAREKKEMDIQINRLMKSTKGFFCTLTKAFLEVQNGFRHF